VAKIQTENPTTRSFHKSCQHPPFAQNAKNGAARQFRGVRIFGDENRATRQLASDEIPGIDQSGQILLVLGPSGVGKSTFAEYLYKERHWLHLEIDQYPNDGIDLHDLRQQWDLFYGSRKPDDLVMEIRKRSMRIRTENCVLSFPSGVVLSPGHIAAAERAFIRVAYLYGSAAHCINAFLERERKSGRNLGLDHWLANNTASYLMMSDPAFQPYRTHVFNFQGKRRSHPDVLREINKR
jgi:hypothetical protein